jgi:hypothetical protein
MILCEWDAPEGDPGQSCVHLYARILSSSLTSVSVFSVSCYSIVSISMFQPGQAKVGPGPTPLVATLPPFGPIEGQKWFDRISSQ